MSRAKSNAITAQQQLCTFDKRKGWFQILGAGQFVDTSAPDSVDPQDQDAVDRRKAGPAQHSWEPTIPASESVSEHKVFGRPKGLPQDEKIRLALEARRNTERNLVGQVTAKERDAQVHGNCAGAAQWEAEKALAAKLEAHRAKRALKILSAVYKPRKEKRPASVANARSIRRKNEVGDKVTTKVLKMGHAPMRDLGKAQSQIDDANGVDEVNEVAAWNETGALYTDRFPNMLKGLGRDLTVSQCRDKGVMGAQRRAWTDIRGTVFHAR